MTNDQKQVIPFQFNSQQVRIIQDDQGEPWFVAKDVADILEYRDAANAIRILDDDEKGTHLVSTPGGPQEMSVINESGIYTLILRSDKPQAKPFRKWVTGTVLPSIRKTGRFEAAEQTPPPKKQLDPVSARALVQVYRQLARDKNLPEASRTIVLVKAAEVLSEESHTYLLPAIVNERHQWLTPTQLAQKLCVSVQLVGRRLKKLKLHGDFDVDHEWSEPYRDKSQYSAKEVISYRYDPDVVLEPLRADIQADRDNLKVVENPNQPTWPEGWPKA